MAAFTAYFDGSGSPSDTPVVTVAGFIATSGQWIEFERNWRDACSAFGVSALHMKDYAHSRGEFESWKGDNARRARFMERLVSVIRTRVRNSFASVVVVDDYVQMSSQYRGLLKPYTLAACTCIDKVKRWAVRQHVDESKIAYLFRGWRWRSGRILSARKVAPKSESTFSGQERQRCISGR